VVMNEVIKGIQWYMLFADDIVLVGDNLEEWRLALEGKGLRINRNKTEHINRV